MENLNTGKKSLTFHQNGYCWWLDKDCCKLKWAMTLTKNLSRTHTGRIGLILSHNCILSFHITAQWGNPLTQIEVYTKWDSNSQTLDNRTILYPNLPMWDSAVSGFGCNLSCFKFTIFLSLSYMGSLPLICTVVCKDTVLERQ